jgi:hypothetical protein
MGVDEVGYGFFALDGQASKDGGLYDPDFAARVWICDINGIWDAFG